MDSKSRNAASVLRVAFACLGAAAVAMCHIAVGGAATPEKLRDVWDVVYLNGQKTGHAHETVHRLQSSDGVVYESRARQEFTFLRGKLRLEFIIESVVREDERGRVVSFSLEQRQGPAIQQTEGKVQADEMVLETTSGGVTTTSRIRAPSGLGPHAIRELRGRKGFEPGTEYTVSTFLPEFPDRAVKAHYRVGSVEDREVAGSPRRLHPIHCSYEMAPAIQIQATEWVDVQNRTWITRVPIGAGLTLVTRRASKEAALAEDKPTDLMEAAIIRPDRPIERPRRVERLRLLLVPVSEDVELPDLPAGPCQTVKRTDRGIEVNIRRAHPALERAYAPPYGGEEYGALLLPNQWLETEEPVIAEMSREAAGDAGDALTAARRIERYVRRHISRKSLAMGMATAAQTARQKEGDCTEHAMLVAALARAAGIPARVVEGVAYVSDSRGGMFGYHMWAEAYVGEWLPLDAALEGHDATHLVLARSSLNEPGQLSGLVGLMRFFGKFDIRVLEVVHPGSEPEEPAA